MNFQFMLRAFLLSRLRLVAVCAALVCGFFISFVPDGVAQQLTPPLLPPLLPSNSLPAPAAPTSTPVTGLHAPQLPQAAAAPVVPPTVAAASAPPAAPALLPPLLPHQPATAAVLTPAPAQATTAPVPAAPVAAAVAAAPVPAAPAAAIPPSAVVDTQKEIDLDKQLADVEAKSAAAKQAIAQSATATNPTAQAAVAAVQKPNQNSAAQTTLTPPATPAPVPAAAPVAMPAATVQAKAEPPKPVPPVAPSQPAVPKNMPVSMGSDNLNLEDDAAFLRSLVGNDQSGIIMLDVNDVSIAPDVLSTVHVDEAVAFSLKNNYEVLASDKKVSGAWYDKAGAYSEYAPSVAVSVASGTEYSAPASINDQFGNRVLESNHPRLDRNLTVRQPLLDLSVIADILKEGNAEDLAKDDQRDAREGTAFDTVNTYLKLIQARIAIRLADQYKAYLDDLSVRMKARVEGGGGTDADLERIKGRTTTAESARVEALGDYETNIAEMRRLTRITPAKIQIPNHLAPTVPSNIEEALDRAAAANPSYKSSLDKIDAAKADRDKSFSGLLPKLSLQYEKDYTYDAGGAAQGNPVDGVYPNQNTNSLMVVAQWMLNGGTAITGGMSGIEKESEMRLRAQDVVSRLEQSIRTSYQAVNAANRRIKILKEAVKADAKVASDFEAQYKEGNRSLFDILDAYEQLYAARLNLIRVIIARAQASFQIRRQMGDMVHAIYYAEGQ